MGEEKEFNFEVEAEWKRVDKLLAQKSEASWMLAVVEAHKVFRQVLGEVSFGETVDDRVHNASELFRDMPGLLESHRVYQQVLDESGFKLSNKEAKKTCAALLRAVLDMVGRDFQDQGFWHRLANGLNFFWGHHPRSLVGFVAGILLFVVAVWFLADTVAGKWLVDLAVGFSRFVLEWREVLIGLLVVLVVAAVLSLINQRRSR